MANVRGTSANRVCRDSSCSQRKILRDNSHISQRLERTDYYPRRLICACVVSTLMVATDQIYMRHRQKQLFTYSQTVVRRIKTWLPFEDSRLMEI